MLRQTLQFTIAAVLLIACGQSNKLMPDAMPPGSDAGTSPSIDAPVDAPVDAPPDVPPDAPPGGPAAGVALSDTEIAFATPDLSRTLMATVTGNSNPAVTWSSSDSYIATVSATGVVTSVSGGQATITATSVADPSLTASCKVTIAEPDRPRATSYTDARTITSGPIRILMCGDSLMRTYVANSSDQAGWGQVLDQFLTADATVDNSIADGGRSSRSFYNEVGRWDEIKARLVASVAAGVPTFVFVMFAHNDEKQLTDVDGADFLTFASHNQNGSVAGTYYDYLERYIVETRALGGIPILLTPVVRETLSGAPPQISDTGRHDLTAAFPGETAPRGDYPAAMRAIAAKHDVPLVDITAWSTAAVEARAAAGTLDRFYIADDQTHIRELGALLVAQEAVRQLNALGIFTGHARAAGARLMIDAGNLAFGGVFAGNTVDKSFLISPFGDVTGTITLTAPTGYTVSTDGAAFAASATIAADAGYAGGRVTVRFAPSDAIVYNADLVVAHSAVTPDFGNSPPGAAPGVIALTGNGKTATTGAPAAATWPMFSGTAIVLDPTTDGAVSATTATLTGLRNKNVANGGARFDTLDGNWPAESVRNPDRYVEFTIPVAAGSFTVGEVSLDAGSGGGSNMRWDVVYSLQPDFSAPTVLGGALSGAKDTLVHNDFPGLGVNVTAGQTFRVRVYPYDTTTTTGKSIMLANVVVSGVTN